MTQQDLDHYKLQNKGSEQLLQLQKSFNVITFKLNQIFCNINYYKFKW